MYVSFRSATHTLKLVQVQLAEDRGQLFVTCEWFYRWSDCCGRFDIGV